MHLTKNATKNAGFTLVELIVVITILAILATIAFISYQGYTSEARNAKRTSDLTTLERSIGTKRASNQIPLSSLSDTSSKFTGGSNFIAGSGATNLATSGNYGAGNVNYAILGLKQADLQDPDKNVAYKLGWTTKKNGQFELAATVAGDTPKAIVKGTYAARTGLTGVAGTGTTNSGVTVAAGSGALFFVGDLTSLGTITAISPDLKTLTFDSGATSGAVTSVYLLNSGNEVKGLINSTITANTAVTDGSTELPY